MTCLHSLALLRNTRQHKGHGVSIMSCLTLQRSWTSLWKHSTFPIGSIILFFNLNFEILSWDFLKGYWDVEKNRRAKFKSFIWRRYFFLSPCFFAESCLLIKCSPFDVWICFSSSKLSNVSFGKTTSILCLRFNCDILLFTPFRISLRLLGLSSLS